MSLEKPPRPDPLDVNPSAVPDTLTDRDTWVCWRYKFDTDRDEWTKVPVDVNTGGFASSTDADTWAAFEDAVEYHNEQGTDTDGIGFILHDEDTVVGLDLDDCRDPETGDREEWADQVLESVSTYAEVSPSATGLRLLGLGFLPDGGNRADIENEPGHLELYDTGRYLTVTGHRIEDTPKDVSQVHQAVKDVHGAYIATDAEPTAGESGSSGVNPTLDADRTGSVSLSDTELLEKAKSAENGEQFRALWNGNTSGYPSQSEADQALVNHLAFWTGGDRQRIDSLFRDSGLYREKWDADRGNRTYGERTIDTALADRTEFYDPDTSRERDAGEDATDGDEWTPIYQQYVGADEASDRKPARYDATELLSDAYSWANLEENDTLYAYDGDCGFYKPTGEKRVRELLVSNLREEYAKNEKTEILDQLRGRHTVSQSEMGGPAYYVPVRNGVLDVEPPGLTLEEHDPSHRFLGAVDVDYNADADCPQFREFLTDVVQTEGQRKKLQEYAGYTLMHWGLPHHKALFLVGPTASGKSTFLDAIRGVLGENTVVSLTPQELTGERFAGAELFQSWANFRNDIPSSLIEDTGAFKEITAGDSIKAEQKFKDPFRFEPTAKHLFSANQLPDAETDDEAFYRRVLLVPFPSTVPRDERDPHLDEKLQSEQSGILNWMLEGLQRLIQQGTFTNDRAPGETQRTWEKWGNTVDRFREVCLAKDEDSSLPKQTAYQAYHRYCEAENLPAETQHKMTRRLKKEGIADGRATVNGKQQRVFVGVQLTGKGESYLDDDESSQNSGIRHFD